jgi:predicted ATPase
LHTGDIEGALGHIDQAMALYDPVEHRQLATRFGQDVRVALSFYQSLSRWPLGFPEAALADADRAIKDARDVGQAATLMAALTLTSLTHIHCGSYQVATMQLDEAIALADEKGALFWKTGAMLVTGCLLAVTGKSADAVLKMTNGLNAWRQTGTTVWTPAYFSYLARAHADLGQIDEASRRIGEALSALQTTRETWYEAEIHRIAGEIALRRAEPDVTKAEACFERALAVARAQRAKSWELRAAMSLARLKRDQGRPDVGRNLLAPVYEWFTEGFETVDLKEAKSLLKALG